MLCSNHRLTAFNLELSEQLLMLRYVFFDMATSHAFGRELFVSQNGDNNYGYTHNQCILFEPNKIKSNDKYTFKTRLIILSSLGNITWENMYKKNRLATLQRFDYI